MSWRRERYAGYFTDVLGGKATTLPTYRSYLNRIDDLSGGLDALIEERGVEGAREWGKLQTAGPFGKQPGDARSILNSISASWQTENKKS